MKTYFTNEAESYYNTEVAAFRHLGINPSIIKFHGSFARGDNYNVLLEYADKGTLADYFKNEMPPSDGDEIIRFWEAMFKLLDALRRIHEVGADDTDGPRVFQGYVTPRHNAQKCFVLTFWLEQSTPRRQTRECTDHKQWLRESWRLGLQIGGSRYK